MSRKLKRGRKNKMKKRINQNLEKNEIPEHYVGYDCNDKPCCLVVKATAQGLRQMCKVSESLEQMRKESISKSVVEGWFVSVGFGDDQKTKGPFENMQVAFDYCANTHGVERFSKRKIVL